MSTVSNSETKNYFALKIKNTPIMIIAMSGKVVMSMEKNSVGELTACSLNKPNTVKLTANATATARTNITPFLSFEDFLGVARVMSPRR